MSLLYFPAVKSKRARVKWKNISYKKMQRKKHDFVFFFLFTLYVIQ